MNASSVQRATTQNGREPHLILNFFGNDKGGVGKTPSAINFAAFIKAKGLANRVIDADVRATSMAITFPDATIISVSEVEVVECSTGLGELIRIARQDRGTVVIDTGANVRPILHTFFDITNFPQLVSELGIVVNFLVPIDHSRESRIFAMAMQKMWPWAHFWHVHMLNRPLYDRSRYPEHPNERVIVFPYLPEGMRAELQNGSLTLDQAIERRVFKEFLQAETLVAARSRLYAQFENTRGLLFTTQT